MATLVGTLRIASHPPSPLSPRAILSSFPTSSSSTSLRILPSHRLFTASSLSRATTPSRPQARETPKSPPPSTSTSTSTSSSPPAAPSRYAFIKSLASRPSPTVLYEAPSHFWFYLGCWSSGLSILSWTVLTGPTVISQPDGIPQWVGLVFGASYAILGSMGFNILSKTPNIVSSIRLLPPPPPPPQAIARGSAAAAAPPAAAPAIEIKVKRMLPLLEPRTVTAPLDKVSLKSRFSLPPELVPELRRMQARDAALRRSDMQHLLTMPFRRLARAVVGFFRGVRAAWTGMGYGVIRIDGKEYKVDVTGGYAHDGFQTLERIVSVGK
ncbi:hypothetical protein ESCO_002403 [Escovopsis weberi]|uniref:Uncharacterized protein n=1 Tax=Escovopsis weberi TaxID=150374 RepID=A0A0M8MRK9_ESCWE|nr:hypothetical protein ESCO_002403 [Escovopsis weberi]